MVKQSALKARKKIFFVSDAHLGLAPETKSREREKLLVEWLDSIKDEALAIYLMGDIFDYWFEYKKVVPRGFVRFLGKIAEITDGGVEVYYFTGNHDVWVFDYVPKETGVKVIRNPMVMESAGKKFYLAHGDGLGPGDLSYKLLRKIFTCPILQWIYARIHPNFSTAFAHRWSRHSRLSKGGFTPFLGEEKEDLIIHSKSILEKQHFDYFIYGHRHLPLEFNLKDGSKIIYLGDWYINFTYAVFDGNDVSIRHYLKDAEDKII